MADVQKENRARMQARSYPDMEKPGREWISRYLIQPKDVRALYRTHNHSLGLDVRNEPHDNIHQWLNPSSPAFNPKVARTVFHYVPRTDKQSRLEIGIATPEMFLDTWKYVHLLQMIMDGTFGVCSSKMLVFCIMGVDEEGHGVLLAMLMFSAPSGNKQTSSGYDSKILEKLLGIWKQNVEAFNEGKPFSPATTITDTDLKERIALAKIFPSVVLLICRVHLKRSWRNHQGRSVKGIFDEAKTVLKRLKRLKRLELALIATGTIIEARQLIVGERLVVVADVDNGVIREGAIKHLEYLDSYWVQEGLWDSWSDGGRNNTATVLKCSSEAVYMTTNHLEAFNRVFKKCKIGSQQRNGRRLRVDQLLMYVTTDMLPLVAEIRHLVTEEKARHEARVRSLPGGNAVWEARERRRLEKNKPSSCPIVAYLQPDLLRDVAASELVERRQISAPTPCPRLESFAFTCLSSLALEHDSIPLSYTVQLSVNGIGSCSCPDFQSNGGACKHMRAGLAVLNGLRSNRGIPPIILPSNPQVAFDLISQLSTPPMNASTSSREFTSTAVVEKLNSMLLGDG